MTSLHRPRAAGEAGARGGRRARARHEERFAHRIGGYLPGLLPRPGLPGPKAGLVGARTGSSARWPATCPTIIIPIDQPLAAAPRLIELCFQTAGLLEMAVQHRMGLPRHVDRVVIGRPMARTDRPLYAVVTPDPVRDSFDAEVIDGSGNRCLQVTGYQTVTFREDVTAELLRPLTTVVV